MYKRSNISGMHKLSSEERLQKVAEFAELNEDEKETLRKNGSLEMGLADSMIENVIGTSELPFGIATNFRINGKDYLIPMVLEEPSVVAAASNAAKLTRPDGFHTESDDPVMIGQIQLVGCPDPEKAKEKILQNKQKIIGSCNENDPTLVKYGGGARDIEIRVFDTPRGKMILVHLIVNVADAMGANIINTMGEGIAPYLEELTGGKVRLRIVSNLATKRLARAKAVWKKEVIGEETIEGILDGYHLADNDQYRCTTHNKGIMNGVDAVVIATGNDFRAVEAGAHSFAALDGRYKPLTRYHKNDNGDLVGEIEIPTPIGLVGGATRTHPVARVAVKILGVKNTKEFGEVLAAVGLAQNFAALRALSTEGIQKGHMRLHARNIAIMAGAEGDMAQRVAEKMIKEGQIKVHRAKEILEELLNVSE